MSAFRKMLALVLVVSLLGSLVFPDIVVRAARVTESNLAGVTQTVLDETVSADTDLTAGTESDAAVATETDVLTASGTDASDETIQSDDEAQGNNSSETGAGEAISGETTENAAATSGNSSEEDLIAVQTDAEKVEENQENTDVAASESETAKESMDTSESTSGSEQEDAGASAKNWFSASVRPNQVRSVLNNLSAASLLAVSAASLTDSDSVDLADYITAATFNKSEITAGDTVKVTLDYEIYSAVLKSAGTDTLSYTLPEGIMPVTTYTGYVYNGSVMVGTYTITPNSTSGTIKIDLYDSFVNSGNTITGDISFWSTLSASGSAEGENTSYSFSDSNEVTTTIKITSNTSGDVKKTDLYVDKTCTGYTLNADGTITATYSIVISSTKGTADTISLTDTFYSSISNITGGTVANLTITKTTSSGTEAVGNTGTWPAVGTSASTTLLSGGTLEALSAGESYTVTYTVKYSGDVSEVNGSLSISNTASAKSGDDSNSDGTYTSIPHTYISKSGYRSGNSIYWTVTLNDFGANLEDYTFRDTLTESNSGESVEIKEMTVTEYLSDGLTVAYTVSGSSFVIAQADSSHTAGDTEMNGSIITLYVADTTDKLVVTYTTDVSDVGFYDSYSNNATLGKDGGTGGYESGNIGVSVSNTSGVLTKSYDEEKSTEKDETTGIRTYAWEAILKLPSDGIKAGSYYYDSISSTWYAANGYTQTITHYITATQLRALTITGTRDSSAGETILGSDIYTVQVKDGTGAWETLADSVDGATTYTEFRILFNSALEQTTYKTLTIAYSTTADLSGLSDTTWTFTNTGQFYQDGGTAYASASKKESQGGYLTKSDIGGSSDNTYVYDENKGILYYGIVINANESMEADGEIVLTDVLPEGTTLYMDEWDIMKVLGNNKSTATGTATLDTGNGVKAYFGNYDSNVSVWQIGNLYNPYASSQDINDYITVDYDEDINTLTITIPQDMYYGRASNSSTASNAISIFYAVQITDALGRTESKEYTNSVTMEIGNSTYTDSVTDTVDFSYLTKTLDSDADTDSDDKQQSYQVMINPTAAELNGGNDYTVTDTVEYGEYITSVSLVPGSFALYYMKSDGTTGNEVSTSLYSVSYEEVTQTVSSGNGGSTESKSFVMTITVKDSTAYILKYSYAYTVDEDEFISDNNGAGSLSITNKISLEGSWVESDESEISEEMELNGSSASAGTDQYTVTLVKVDETNQIIYLQGAFFTLYYFKANAYKEASDTDEDAYLKDVYWEKEGTYITNEDGTLSLTGLYPGVAYKLVETSTPTNYRATTTAETYYFYYGEESTITNEDGTTTTASVNDLPSGLLEMLTKVESSMITVTNTTTGADNTYIAVQKNWENAKGSTLSGDDITDAKGNVVTGIEIALYRTTDSATTMEQVMLNADGTVAEDTTGTNTSGTFWLTPDNNGDWYFVFNNLPKIKDNGDGTTSTYYYYIVETGSYTYTNSEGKTVTVTVSGGTVSAKTEDGTAVSGASSLLGDDSGQYVLSASTGEAVSAVVSGNTVSAYAAVKGGTTTLTNTANPGTTNISVTKKWAEGTTAADEVTVTLYRSKTAPAMAETKTVNVSVAVSAYGSTSTYSTETVTVDTSGSTIKIHVTTESWSTLTESATYTMGGSDSMQVLGVSDGTAYGYYYTIPNVTGDVVLSVTGAYTTNGKYTVENIDGISGMYVLPDDAEVVTYTGNASQQATVALGSSYANNNSSVVYNYEVVGSGNATYPVTGTYSEDGWSYTWARLPEEYYYYVVEGTAGSISGYSAAYSYTKDGEGTVTGVTITNTKADTTSISVTKVWNDSDYTPGREDVTVKLYRYSTDNPNVITYTISDWTSDVPEEKDLASYVVINVYKYENWSAVKIGQVVLNSENNWTASFYDYDGTSSTTYYYQSDYSRGGGINSIWKNSQSASSSSYSWMSDAMDGSGTYYLGASYTAENAGDGLWSDSVTVTADDTGYMGEGYDVILSSSNNWTATWDNLSATDGSGKTYTYRVGEVSVDGYVTTYAYGDGAVTITNTLTDMPDTTNVSAEKVWKNAAGTDITSSATTEITVTLYQVTDNGNGTTTSTQVGDAVTLGSSRAGTTLTKTENGVSTAVGYYSSDGWTFTWINLEANTYYVVEGSDTNADKYVTTYAVTETTTDSVSGETTTVTKEAVSEASAATTTGGIITITNQKVSTSISVEKEWAGVDDSADHSVTLDLYRSTTELSEDTDAVTITIDVSKWYYSNGATKGDESDGSGNAIWAGIYKAKSGEENFWTATYGYTQVSSITIGAWNDWTSSVTLEAPEDGYSYYIAYNANDTDITSLDVVSMIGGYMSATSTTGGTWVVTGDTEDNVLDLAATLNMEEYDGTDTTITVSGSVTLDTSGFSADGASLTLANADPEYVWIWFGIFNTTTFEMAYETTLNSDTAGGTWAISASVPGTTNGVAQTYTVLYSFGTGILSSEVEVAGMYVTTQDSETTVEGSAMADTSVSVSMTITADEGLFTVTGSGSVSGGSTSGDGGTTGNGSGTGDSGSTDNSGTVGTSTGSTNYTDGSYLGSWDGELVDTKTLTGTVSATDAWRYEWSILDKYDASGNLYYYYIVESAADGKEAAGDGYYTTYAYYDASGNAITVVNGSISSSSEIAKVVITNTKSFVITAEKKWVYSDGTEISAENLPGSISVQLYKKASGSGDDTLEDTVTLNSYNNWSYIWELTESGEYYVAESDSLAGYEVSYSAVISGGTSGSGSADAASQTLSTDGTITITNTYEYDKASLTVTKKWSDSDAHEDEEVTVNLYRATQSTGQTAAEVSTGGNGTGTISVGISAWFSENGDAVGCLDKIDEWWTEYLWVGVYDASTSDWWNYYISGTNLYYSGDWTAIFTELETGKDYYVSISLGSGCAILQGFHLPSGSEQLTSTNLLVSLKTDTSYTVELSAVVDASKAAGTWELYDKVKLGTDYSASSGYTNNGWSYTWDDIYEKSADGQKYYYYIEETSISGYTTSYALSTIAAGRTEATEVYTGVSSGAVSAVSEGCIYTVEITNTKNMTIRVTKHWLDTDGTEITDQMSQGLSLTVNLYQENGTEPYATATLNESNSWTYSFTAEQGYSYYVEELAVSGYTAKYYVVNGGEGSETASEVTTEGNSLVITNTKDKIITTDITAVKEWVDGDVDHSGDVVKIKLYRSGYFATTGTATVVVGNGEGSITVAASNWVDPNNNTVFPSPEAVSDAVDGTITVSIQKSDEYGNWNGELGSYSMSASTDWECEFTGIDDGYYVVVYAYSGTNITNVFETTTSDTGGHNVQLNGSDVVDLTVVLDSDASAWGEAYSEEIELGDSHADTNNTTGYSSDGWGYSWTDLPRYSDDGCLYNYYVVETSMGDYVVNTDYVISDEYDEKTGTDRVTATVTITNTKLVYVTVTKKWLDVDGSEMADAPQASVIVSLFEGSDWSTATWLEYITLGTDYVADANGHKTTSSGYYSDDGWSFTWTGLEYDSYFVQEDSVSGYVTTYSAESGLGSSSSIDAAVIGGTITVSNQAEATSIAVKKEWADGKSHESDKVEVKLYQTTMDPNAEPQTGTVTVSVNYVDSAGNKVDSSLVGGGIWGRILLSDWQTTVVDSLTPGESYSKLGAGTLYIYSFGYYSGEGTYVVTSFSNFDNEAYGLSSSWVGVPDGTPIGNCTFEATTGTTSIQITAVVAEAQTETTTPEKTETETEETTTAAANSAIEMASGFEVTASAMNLLSAEETFANELMLSIASENETTSEAETETASGAETEAVAESGSTGATLYATVTLASGKSGTDGSGTSAGTYGADGWSYTWSNLPKYDSNGNLYYYYVVETSVDGYTATYSATVTDDSGAETTTTGLTSGEEAAINGGTITITNTSTEYPSYVLPQTSGITAVHICIMGGILLFVSAVFLITRRRVRYGKKPKLEDY